MDNPTGMPGGIHDPSPGDGDPPPMGLPKLTTVVFAEEGFAEGKGMNWFSRQDNEGRDQLVISMGQGILNYLGFPKVMTVTFEAGDTEAAEVDAAVEKARLSHWPVPSEDEADQLLDEILSPQNAVLEEVVSV